MGVRPREHEIASESCLSLDFRNGSAMTVRVRRTIVATSLAQKPRASRKRCLSGRSGNEMQTPTPAAVNAEERDVCWFSHIS